MKTYTIEVKVDFTDEAKHELIRGIMRQAAQQIHASSLLLTDQRRPQIAFYSNDFFQGVEELQIHEGIDATAFHTGK